MGVINTKGLVLGNPSSRAAAVRRHEEMTQDVTELLSWGVSPEEIAARLDLTSQALARRFERRGQTDLARPFNAAAYRIRARRNGVAPR